MMQKKGEKDKPKRKDMSSTQTQTIESRKKRFNTVFLYIKASLASQIASWIDMGTAFALFAWAGFNAMYSTGIGAIAGGVVNCIINYKWTFKAKDVPVVNVAIKYFMVWIGSFLLNTFGTSYVTALFEGWQWLDKLGMDIDARFAIARVGVSLIVSVFWNFMLQRYFVYKNLQVKKYIKDHTTLHRK